MRRKVPKKTRKKARMWVAEEEGLLGRGLAEEAVR